MSPDYCRCWEHRCPVVLCPACYADSLRADSRTTWRFNYCGPQEGCTKASAQPYQQQRSLPVDKALSTHLNGGRHYINGSFKTLLETFGISGFELERMPSDNDVGVDARCKNRDKACYILVERIRG
jgi:hypothetical protein